MAYTQAQISFVKANAKLATNAGRKYMIHPVILLAHSAIESGWGTSYSAINRKNYFGITTTGNGAKTLYWDGKYSVSTASGLKFRVYKDAQSSFYDYAYLISTSSSYKDVYKNAQNVEQFAKAISQSAYLCKAMGDNPETYYPAFVATAASIANIAKSQNQSFTTSNTGKVLGLVALALVVKKIIF